VATRPGSFAVLEAPAFLGGAVQSSSFTASAEGHFSQLASLQSYSDCPLFALEHGLTEDEFDEITRLLHAQLENAWKPGRHCPCFSVVKIKRVDRIFQLSLRWIQRLLGRPRLSSERAKV
jgi:hypothetical protein